MTDVLVCGKCNSAVRSRTAWTVLLGRDTLRDTCPSCGTADMRPASLEQGAAYQKRRGREIALYIAGEIIVLMLIIIWITSS